MDRVLEPELMDIPERAQAYADADFSEVNAAFVDRLCALVPHEAPLRALDLGTGPGEIPLLLARKCPKWRVVAVDASLPMLQLAEQSRIDQAPSASLHFTLTDAKRLPFPNATFDLVFSNSLLHHLPDPAPFWSEIQRVAKPQAQIFVRDLCRSESPQIAQSIVETYAADEHPLLKEDFYNSLLAAFLPAEVEDMLAETGLTDVSVQQVTDRHLDVFGRATSD